jgi:DNA-binding NarL/FixJ family response regulator
MIELVIVDDSALIRAAIAEELNGQADMRVVGEASNGQEGYEVALSVRPHIVVTDMRIGKLDGAALAQRIKAVAPEITVIGMSVFFDEATQQAMRQAGAAGFIAKDKLLLDLVRVIREVTGEQAGHGTSPTASSPIS